MKHNTKRYMFAVGLLITVSFVINLGFSALSPVFPYLILALKGILKELPELTKGVIEAHKGATEFGFLMAAFMIARAPTAGIAGFISDILGKKITLLLGMSVYMLTTMGFIFSNNLKLFIVFRALQGIGSGMVWPTAEAYLADITPKWSRGKAISAYTASMTLAEVFGPSIGVAIYKLYIKFFGSNNVIMALKAPIAFLALACLISLIMLLFLPEIVTRRSRGTAIFEGFKVVLTKLKEMPKDIARSIKVMYVNGVINGFAVGILDTAVMVYIIERVVKDPKYIGMFYTMFALIGLPVSLVAGYISDRTRKRKPLILLGYILGRLAFFLIPLTTSYTLMLVIGALASVTFSLSAPIMRALQADLAPLGTRGSIFGLQQLFFNLGTFAGAIIGGYLTEMCSGLAFNVLGHELSGYAIPFWSAGVLGIITTLLFAIYVVDVRS